MATPFLGPPETEREQRCTQSELEAATRRLDYDFFDQLDCFDLSDLSSCYEEADGAD